MASAGMEHVEPFSFHMMAKCLVKAPSWTSTRYLGCPNKGRGSLVDGCKDVGPGATRLFRTLSSILCSGAFAGHDEPMMVMAVLLLPVCRLRCNHPSTLMLVHLDTRLDPTARVRACLSPSVSHRVTRPFYQSTTTAAVRHGHC